MPKKSTSKSVSPTVSIVIPCYNLGRYLPEAVNSVLAQSFTDYEIIVVDDGSTEGRTRRVLQDLPSEKTAVYLIPNQGANVARNYGIERARGKYICCLDADDRLHPDFLAKTVSVLQKATPKNKLGLVACHYQAFGRSSEIITVPDFQPYLLFATNPLPTVSLFRRDLWQKVGGYTPDLTGYQDWDFWLKLIVAGYRWRVVPEVLFYYRHRRGSLVQSANAQRVALHQRMLDKHRRFCQEHSREIMSAFVAYLEPLKASQEKIHHHWLYGLWQKTFKK